MFVFINGSLVPKEEAKVSVFDRGFLYGDGVFETVRIYNGRPFMIDEHITRLLQGLKAVRFTKLPAGLKVYAAKVIDANGVRNGILRIAVTRGEVISGIDPSACKEPTIVISARESVPYPDAAYETGYRVTISKIRKDGRSHLCGIKSANFLTHILAKGEAADAGVDDAVMVNYDGFVTEATVSNVFVVKGNALVTPSVESGILPGITRKVVLEMAEKMGLEVSECEIRPEELCDADEAFLTNSLMEVMPLVKVDKRAIGNGLPGNITRKVRKNYQQIVKKKLE